MALLPSCAPNCDAPVRAREAYESLMMGGRIIVILLAIAVVVSLILWRRRRQIGRAVDNAAVSTLATGVRASRKVADRADAYRQRVIAKAGVREPRTDR